MKTRARRLTERQRETEKEASRLETRRRSLVNQMAEQLRLLRGHRAQEAQLVAAHRRRAAGGRRSRANCADLREQLGGGGGDAERAAGEAGRAAGPARGAGRGAEAGRGRRPEGAIAIEGALSTVFEIIRVPRGLEEAIAAALSDQIEALVFERQAEAIAAIQSVIAQKGRGQWCCRWKR